jgi:hypothetical protein
MTRIKQIVENNILQMSSPAKVYDLFEMLGYKILSPDYHGKESWGLKEKDQGLVNEIYGIANYDKRFQILLIELNEKAKITPGHLRNLALSFEQEIQYPFFIFTQDYKNFTFVLVEKQREDVGVWKRKIIKLNLDRENAYHTDKEIIASIAITDLPKSPMDIYKLLKDALNVEKVSKSFFEDYKAAFFDIRKYVLKQDISIKQAHEFTQQLLNRIMFIYFIDKKHWLKHSPGFMRWYWNKYSEQKNKKEFEDQFYTKWLQILFLEAFNNRFSHPAYMPQDFKDVLALAPYLNGGLFKDNELDHLDINLPDNFLYKILMFFNKYNFTIREDLPLDVEVAVDPQMIGYVYESLANVAEEIYERQDLGIFYTPKVEVDFMCRRSLLEYLTKSTDIKKEIMYSLLFEVDSDEVNHILTQQNFESLEEALDNLAVVDPACGSGAFLVGMLNVLVDLYRLIFRHLNREMTDYQLKKRIIGKSLYGVDIMPWAVHSAELRLWLSLMIESDLTLSDLKLYPLLPNLNLKLRVGDSLVQELGGLNLNLRDLHLSMQLKHKLNELKAEKEKYYNNEPTAKFKSENAILEEELRIFTQILSEQIINLTKKRQALTISQPEQIKAFETTMSQKDVFDTEEVKKTIEKEIQAIDNEVAFLTNIKSKIHEKKPFIWDINFAEIFGDKGGFDIVIGNPPYVRQEKIAPPNKLRTEITNEEKRDYKDKLLKSVQVQFPQIRAINRKSDYYIYFYFHGLALLNDKGTFCFITSNSWLDVGYGKDLQEFLIKYVPIYAIYDNQSKRSFEHADVNTIIALFGAPTKSFTYMNDILNNIAKFIMFKKPFDEVINTENMIAIEKTDSSLTTDDFRVLPKKQAVLLAEGWEYPEENLSVSLPGKGKNNGEKVITISQPILAIDPSTKFSVGSYSGNKWGGKYLRALDIYYTILEKGKGKMVKLGDIADIRFGIKTGCNEFFYLEPIGEIAPKGYLHIQNKAGWVGLIEEEYLRPVIKSPRECKSILVDTKGLKYKIFMCHKSKSELKNTNALEYIKWGEKQKFDKIPSCQGRTNWWNLGTWDPPDMVWSDAYNDRYATFNVPKGHYADKRFFYINPKEYKPFEITKLFLNSIIIPMYIENEGIVNLAEGVIYTNVYWLKKIPVLYNIDTSFSLISFQNKQVTSIFDELGFNSKQPIRSQNPNPLPDRKAIDDIVFDILGLTQAERDEVYWAVCELVKSRLGKAKSM